MKLSEHLTIRRIDNRFVVESSGPDGANVSLTFPSAGAMAEHVRQWGLTIENAPVDFQTPDVKELRQRAIQAGPPTDTAT